MAMIKAQLCNKENHKSLSKETLKQEEHTLFSDIEGISNCMPLESPEFPKFGSNMSLSETRSQFYTLQL